VWPEEQPFQTDRHALLKAAKKALGEEAHSLQFNAYSDQRALFRYEMHTLPNEISSSIGTSTLMAAWNAAVYVAQIEDQRLEEAMCDSRYLDATREVLQKHGKLWFQNESYVISRPRRGVGGRTRPPSSRRKSGPHSARCKIAIPTSVGMTRASLASLPSG
jgi:hypothetical protein